MEYFLLKMTRFERFFLMGVWFVFVTMVLPCLAHEMRDDSVTVGLNLALSGENLEIGEEQLRGYLLAIEEINSRGGILGQALQVVIKDSHGRASRAEKNFLEFYRNGVAMITGSSSSAEAIAQGRVAGEKKLTYMAGFSLLDATTGFSFNPMSGERIQLVNRYVFRWHNNTQMLANAFARIPYLQLEHKTYYCVTADYQWGWNFEAAIKKIFDLQGAISLGSRLIPLWESNIIDMLGDALRQKPDYLILIQFDERLVRWLTQLRLTDLYQHTQVIIPAVDLYTAKKIGAENLAGIITANTWVWNLQEHYPGSRKFVEKYVARYQRYPSAIAAGAWTVMREWASATIRAESVIAEKVIKELENHEFELLKGTEYWRAFDHQCVTSTVIVKGKARHEMTNEWDFFTVLEEVPGHETVPSKQENPVNWQEIW